MSIMREDFRKKIARHDGGFTFQAEWLNMLRGKDNNYRDWFLDVVMAYGDNPLRYRLEPSEQERFESEYRDYCDEVEELKEEGGQQ